MLLASVWAVEMMILASIWTHPAFSLFIGIATLALGYLGYRHSQQIDKMAAKAVTASREAESVKDAFDMQDQIIERLEREVKRLETRIEVLEKRLLKESV